MKHIIAVAAIKGGTGKTATAGALAQAAAADGKRALAIDLDPQSNLSFWFRADPDGATAFSVLSAEDPAQAIRQAIQKTESGVDLVPGSSDLIGIKTGGRDKSARRLEAAVDAIKKEYDFIVIDTGPTMGELQNNAIFAATEILAPLEADIFSLQGFSALRDIVARVKKDKPRLKYAGLAITLYDGRPTANRQLREWIEKTAAEIRAPYLGEIRRCVKVRESMAMGEPLFEYAPKCKAAADYMAMYKQIMEG